MKDQKDQAWKQSPAKPQEVWALRAVALDSIDPRPGLHQHESHDAEDLHWQLGAKSNEHAGRLL